MLHINVQHNPTYVFLPPLSHCSGFVGCPGPGRSSESEQPLPPGSIVGHASSGQFLGSLLSDRCAQLLRVAVADGALRSRMRLSSHFIEYLTTALVRLYFAALPAKTRGTMLCWHFSLDLSQAGDDFRPMTSQEMIRRDQEVLSVDTAAKFREQIFPGQHFDRWKFCATVRLGILIHVARREN